jgi:16S rRNA (cytidine1402-2'-O)-methyltransferase
MTDTGTLYLIPCLLGDSRVEQSIPAYNTEVINKIDEFIVEDIRSARRFLIKAGITKAIDDLTFHLLNEHTKIDEISHYLESSTKGKDIGLLSDAGCPGIADPGAVIVRIAHRKNIKVVPLIGPSSILLALISSGLNGQNFSFNGYLPKKAEDRIKKLKQLETIALKDNCTQIFIETPYRNDSILKDILGACRSETMLCVASDLTLATEQIRTMSIGEWKNKKHSFNDHPAVFLIGK